MPRLLLFGLVREDPVVTDLTSPYFGPPAKEHYCAKSYSHPGRRCPNHIDFIIKPGGGQLADTHPGTSACFEHLADILWAMPIGKIAGYYTVLTSGSDHRPHD